MGNYKFSYGWSARALGWALFVPLTGVTVCAASCSHLDAGQTTSGSSSGVGSGDVQGGGLGGPSGVAGGSGTPVGSGTQTGGGGAFDATVVVGGSADADIVVTAEAGIDAAKVACGDTNYTDSWSAPYSDADHATFNASAASVASQMSIAELAQQMRGTDPGSGASLNFGDTLSDTRQQQGHQRLSLSRRPAGP